MFIWTLQWNWANQVETKKNNDVYPRQLFFTSNILFQFSSNPLETRAKIFILPFLTKHLSWQDSK